MSKQALVIQGGISRGAFAVGALKKIFEYRPALDFDILAGGGVGALITPFIALKDIRPLIEIFTTKHDRDIIRKHPLVERTRDSSIMDASPLWGLLDHYYTHQLYDKLRNSGKEIYFNAMCLQTHQLTVFSHQLHPHIAARFAHKTLETYDQFLRTLLAANCQPLLLPPIRIDQQEHPIRQYIDAGDRDYASIEMAIAAGATDVYVILQSPEVPAPKDTCYEDLYSILQETLDIFIADDADSRRMLPSLYNDGLKYIESVKRKMMRQGVPQTIIDDWFDTNITDNPFHKGRQSSPVRLHIIRPSAPLAGGPDGLSFDPAAMQDMLAKGETAMEDYLHRTTTLQSKIA